MIFTLLSALRWAPGLAKEAMGDAQHREYARKQGWKTYWSSTGERDVITNKKVVSGVNLNPDFYKR